MRHARRATDLTAVAPIRKEEGKVESKKKTHKPSKGSRKSYKMSTPRGSKPQQQQQAPRTELDYEIERLKAEIQQERQMKLVADIVIQAMYS